MIGTIVVGGSMAQRPHTGGHAWVFLQYLLGFRRLGWEILFVDRLEPEMCRDASGQPCSLEQSVNLRYFLDVMQRFELNDSFALLYDRGTQVVGQSRAQFVNRVRDATLFFNVMGFIDDPDILAAAKRRVFLDIDPGFGQMWRELGLHDLFAGYDDVVTIGQNIGQPWCGIPTCGLQWITTPQPVVLELWPSTTDSCLGLLTSVASWRGAFGPIEFQGRTYGLRVHEFRKFVTLPLQSGHPCLLALDIHPTEVDDLELLRTNAWSLANPLQVARDPDTYQSWIRNSGAEFMVAKSMYVATQSGWMSDRTICYLASGKPCLVQDTALSHVYPVGEGIISFSTIEEALEGVEELRTSYARHSRAAREFSEEYLDSDKVLSRLVDALGSA